MEPTGTDDYAARFDELARLGYRVAFRLLGDREEAADVAQEAMARCFARWRRVAPYAEPWVVRVASNLALGVLRKRRPAGTATERPTPDGADELVTRDELVAALAALPRRQRDVIVLRYVADLPEAEVARVLGCTTGTVKTHAHRALATLRLRLPDDDLRFAGGTG